MNASILLLAGLLQVPQQQAPSPIVRVVVTPERPTVAAQDTLRLSARALDAQGRPVPNATIRFVGAGGRFEGRVDETGLVTSGSTGIFPVSVIATVPGTAPVVHRVEVAMVAGAAARVDIARPISRLVVGQRAVLNA